MGAVIPTAKVSQGRSQGKTNAPTLLPHAFNPACKPFSIVKELSHYEISSRIDFVLQICQFVLFCIMIRMTIWVCYRSVDSVDGL